MRTYWREYTQSREALTKKLLTCADFFVAETWKVRNIPEGGGELIWGGQLFDIMAWGRAVI